MIGIITNVLTRCHDFYVEDAVEEDPSINDVLISTDAIECAAPIVRVRLDTLLDGA